MTRKLTAILLTFLFSALSLHAALDFSVFDPRGFEGSAPMEFNAPEDIIEAPNGNILVADSGNNRIQEITKTGAFVRVIPPLATASSTLAVLTDNKAPTVSFMQDGEMMTIAQTQLMQKTESAFRNPMSMAFDSNGVLYVTLHKDDMLVGLDFKSGKIAKIVARSGKDQGELYGPIGVDINRNDVFAVAEFKNKRVQILDKYGNCLKILIYREEKQVNGKTTSSSLAPRGVKWNSEGHLIVTYPLYHQIVCWDVRNGTVLWRYGTGKEGSDRGMVYNPSFIAQSRDGNYLVSDTLNHRILEISNEGMFLNHYSQQGTSPGRLRSPRGLLLTDDDNLYIADQGNARFHIFMPGKVTIALKEAKMHAMREEWDQVMTVTDKILYMQPTNPEAINLKVNALYYYGNKAFEEKDYTKARDYYKRVLRYRPNDDNIPKKLDSIFWVSNNKIFITIIAGVIIAIGALLLIWVLKLFLSKAFKKKT
ncbi:MAG: hypothetical protein GX221_01590 [Candidatus Riflebacteria bacterium]|nr:hypothetical protein [Candidatus Riflebacteria bacterium]